MSFEFVFSDFFSLYLILLFIKIDNTDSSGFLMAASTVIGAVTYLMLKGNSLRYKENHSERV